MSMRALLDTLTRRPYSRRQKPGTRRLDIEALEDRLVPAASITITDATIVEGNAGTTNALLQVSVTEPHSNAVSVNYTTAQGSALPGSDYRAVSGTLTFKKGEMTKNISIPVYGDRLSEGDESFTVQLSNGKTAWIADGSGTVRITDDDPRITIGSWFETEGNSGTKEFKFEVSLSDNPDETLNVDFATADGSARVSDNDYVETHGTLTFKPGEPLKQTIIVLVNDDHLAENTESFYVNLSNNAQISGSVGVGTIYDDEPRISISGWSETEGNEGTKEFTFTVSLSAAYGQEVKVDFATADGSALVSDNDYVETHGTLTFAPGEPSKEIKVVVNGDMNAEYDEDFYVNLSNATPNAQIANSTGYGTIINDEPTVTIYDAYQEYYGSYMIFYVYLSAESSETVTVDYQTFDSYYAFAGTDYVETHGKLTFDPGVTMQSFTVDLLYFDPDPSKYFGVQFSNASPPVQLANDIAYGYWYYDWGYYYDPGYYDPGYYWY